MIYLTDVLTWALYGIDFQNLADNEHDYHAEFAQ